MPVKQKPLGELRGGTANINGPIFQLGDIIYGRTQSSGGFGRVYGQSNRILHVHFDDEERPTYVILLITLRSGLAIKASATNDNILQYWIRRHLWASFVQ
jgi:hypothetical protein